MRQYVFKMIKHTKGELNNYRTYVFKIRIQKFCENTKEINNFRKI